MTTSIKRKLLWIFFGGLSIGIKAWTANLPAFVETFYSRGVFLGVRWFFDTLLTWIPFPLMYLFWPVLLAVLGRRMMKRRVGDRRLVEKVWQWTLSLAAFLGGVIGLFFWVWGFNYNRLPIEEQLGLSPAALSLEELKRELDVETEQIIDLRAKIPGAAESAITRRLLPKDYESSIREELEDWLTSNGYPTVGRVRGRELYPKGIFLRFSSSGLYFPFTAEGHVDAGVHPLQKPAIIAHELSHGYGFGDEGTCSFTGYLACRASPDPFIAYCGHLNYWRTVASNYLRYKPEAYRAFRATLPIGIQNDLNAINENLDDYPDIMPKFRYYAYDSYLKAQGIDEGMKNYNRVVMLVHAWRNKNTRR